MLGDTPQEVRGKSGDLQRLSREFGVSEDLLGHMYDSDLSNLAAGARIRMFLPILVMRRLERALRRRNSPTHKVQDSRVPLSS
jgi:hypothetical protein